MPEREVSSQKKQGKSEQNRRTQGPNSQPTPQYLMAWDTSTNLIGDTPFYPPMQRHAALLSRASPEQRVCISRQLNDAYGMRYVQRLFKSMIVQTKLTVGAADDPYEREADRVAEQVMNMPTPKVANSLVTSNQPATQREAGKEEEQDLQTKPLASPITPLVQRKRKDEEEVPTKSILQREIPQDEEEIQTTHVYPEQSQDPRGSFEAGINVEERLQPQKGNGILLPDEVRSFMEPRFGADFSEVRIHSDSEAAELNRELSARAFTHGHDIYLGEDLNNLETNEGKRLLAHELTHVVQSVGRLGQKQNA
jgi:hypothetical protein